MAPAAPPGGSPRALRGRVHHGHALLPPATSPQTSWIVVSKVRLRLLSFLGPRSGARARVLVRSDRGNQRGSGGVAGLAAEGRPGWLRTSPGRAWRTPDLRWQEVTLPQSS